MYITLYFKIANDSANTPLDFYKFSKTPFEDDLSGLPLCMGGCVRIDNSNIDAFNKLFKGYMKDARAYMSAKQRCASRDAGDKTKTIISNKMYQDWLGCMLSI